MKNKTFNQKRALHKIKTYEKAVIWELVHILCFYSIHRTLQTYLGQFQRELKCDWELKKGMQCAQIEIEGSMHCGKRIGAMQRGKKLWS